MYKKNEQRGPVRMIISLNSVFYMLVCIVSWCDLLVLHWLLTVTTYSIFYGFQGSFTKNDANEAASRHVQPSPRQKNNMLISLHAFKYKHFSSYFIIMSRMISHYGWIQQNWDNFLFVIWCNINVIRGSSKALIDI